jgi:hypothetical protein
VCPYCENPIQLKGLYPKAQSIPAEVASPSAPGIKPVPPSPPRRPYGSHTGQEEEGFPHFDATDLQYCPYLLKNSALRKEDRRPIGAASNQLIQIAVNEFDRIILLLREDFEIHFSNAFAGRMLEFWFDAEGYRYKGAHLRNLPWMIAYFGPVQSLFGQRFDEQSKLRSAIARTIPIAQFSPIGKLSFQKWRNLDLQCLHHRIIRSDGDDSELTEQMTIRVQDFTNTNDPAKAPTIFKKNIAFDADRFERLLHTSPERAHRDENLLRLAKTIAEKNA